MGFDCIVICCPEHEVHHRLSALRDLIAVTKAAGLGCWADPWGVAGVFDGEAPHAEGQDPEATIAWWIDALGKAPCESRPDAVFWDNPRPADPVRIAAWAHRAQGHGMASHVCLSADRHRGDPDLFRRVAAIEAVAGLGTDPYSLGRPEDFDAGRDVGGMARVVAEAAAAVGKESHTWIQGFRIPTGDEDLPIRAAEAARAHGVGGIGFWSFRACSTWVARPERHEEVWRRFGEWMRENVRPPRGDSANVTVGHV